MAKKSPIQQRADTVKQAHADLSQRPGFRDQSPARQFKETQRAARVEENKKDWGKW